MLEFAWSSPGQTGAHCVRRSNIQVSEPNPAMQSVEQTRTAKVKAMQRDAQISSFVNIAMFSNMTPRRSVSRPELAGLRLPAGKYPVCRSTRPVPDLTVHNIVNAPSSIRRGAWCQNVLLKHVVAVRACSPCVLYM